MATQIDLLRAKAASGELPEEVVAQAIADIEKANSEWAAWSNASSSERMAGHLSGRWNFWQGPSGIASSTTLTPRPTPSSPPSVVSSAPPTAPGERPRQTKTAAPVPEPPDEEEEEDEDDERQPYEPSAGPSPQPSGAPPDLQRLLEPNPYDGRPDSRTTFGQPREYGAGVPGRPSATGTPADTTGRTMARNDLPPFPFGPDQPVEWPQHTPPVGQPGPMGDIGIDVGWGTQGGAGWQALHRKATGWSRQQMTRVPSAYKALHQVGSRPLY